MGKRLLRRPETALFALFFVAYAYFYQAGGWNQNSRFDLVRSIVEQRTSRIDSFYRNTGDLACRGPEGRCRRPAPTRGKHAYCDKAPGASWLAVPAYSIVYAVAGSDRPSARYLAIASHVSTVCAVALPSALAAAMLFWLLGALFVRTRVRLAVALSYGLGTLAFPYATLFYGHQLTAALVLIGFAMLVRMRHPGERDDSVTEPFGKRRLFAIGALLGAAVVVEYPAALAVAPICVYAALWIRPLPRLGWLIAGMAIPGVMLAAYHWIVFGGPLTLPYEFSTQPHRGQGFFMGLGTPRWHAIENILFTGFRGLFYSAPWLLMAIPGAIALARRPRYRAEAIVCVVIALLYIWLNASLVDWEGGWAMGPRYLIPAIPFLAILAAGMGRIPLGDRRRAGVLTTVGSLAFGALSVYSMFHMLVGTAVKPEVPIQIRRPFSQFLLERFYSGDLAVNAQSIDSIAPARTGEPAAWNLGQIIGLDGLMSLIPLALLVAMCALWLRVCLRER